PIDRCSPNAEYNESPLSKALPSLILVQSLSKHDQSKRFHRLLGGEATNESVVKNVFSYVLSEARGGPKKENKIFNDFNFLYF
ncbi:hypothetical protein EBT16_13070, partial [bacterium]|nr:hypothetical protein [bacterium]